MQKKEHNILICKNNRLKLQYPCIRRYQSYHWLLDWHLDWGQIWNSDWVLDQHLDWGQILNCWVPLVFVFNGGAQDTFRQLKHLIINILQLLSGPPLAFVTCDHFTFGISPSIKHSEEIRVTLDREVVFRDQCKRPSKEMNYYRYIKSLA